MAHKFILTEDGEVSVDPPLTGDEPDPLALSIQKWQFIVDCLDGDQQVNHDGATHTCALCHAYRAPSRATHASIKQQFARCCRRCPVRIFTGELSCLGSPMEMWEDGIRTPTVAKAELYFLLALEEYIDLAPDEWDEKCREGEEGEE